ncbi:uncharacterized protein, partial [Bombus flavifrons]|uniref:uncharacterized protein n=1 Tax=Bombus flavifrons TaxID=103934 RepID=UPI003703CAEC
ILKAQEEWLKVARDFDTEYNFPHCIGDPSGKHVILQCPIKNSSEYINYRSFFGIVISPIVDANYDFMFVHMDYQGRISVIQTVGVAYAKTRKLLESPRLLVFLGGEASAMSENLTKVYPSCHTKGTIQRIFNYGLRRARRVVENVFGVASSIYRVLRKPLLLLKKKHRVLC